MSGRGHVYILSNPACPGLLKIGRTAADPARRAARISQPSGVAQPFRVLFALSTRDCAGSERLIHQRLAARRLRPEREFFRVSPRVAIRHARRAVAEVERRRSPDAACGRLEWVLVGIFLGALSYLGWRAARGG